MKSTTQAQMGQLESYAVVAKDRNGEAKVPEQRGKKGRTAEAAKAAPAVDGDPAKIQRTVPPDNSAVIVVLPAPDVSDMNSAMQEAHPAAVMNVPVQPQP